MSDDLHDFVTDLHKRLTVKQLAAILHENYEIEQILGKALHYPQAYPDVGEVDDGSVVTGPNIPITLAQEAAERIRYLEKELDGIKKTSISSPQ